MKGGKNDESAKTVYYREINFAKSRKKGAKMKRKYIFVGFIILTFVLVAMQSTFCLSQIKEVDMEKQREEIKEYIQKGDHELAISLAKEYLKTDSANIEILLTLAECNLGIGNLTEAEESAKKAFSIESTNPWVLKTLAKIYREKAEQAESSATKSELLSLAQAKTEEALKIDSNDAWANAEAALIYLAQRDKKQANKLIEKALKLQPNDEYIKGIKTTIETSF